MTNNKKKNILLIIAATILFLAVLDGWQYGFFTILRFAVSALTAYVAWMAHENKRDGWVWTFGFIAVLFNPFFPVYLARDTWVVIDFIVGLFLVSAIFVFKLGNKLS